MGLFQWAIRWSALHDINRTKKLAPPGTLLETKWCFLSWQETLAQNDPTNILCLNFALLEYVLSAYASGYLVGQAMANEEARVRDMLADLDAMKNHLRARSKVLKVEEAMANAASDIQAEIQIELIEKSLGRRIPAEHARLSNPANRDLRNREYEDKAKRHM